ncbi:MAG TPA: JAB domain-containing protein, partial [Longimicrobiaceae bacterium]|nr:JAB domain-containing protein [Longimicrobiaceae bacterium]
PVLDPHAPGSSPAGPARLVPVYAVKLVRTDTLALRERPKVHHPADVAALLEKHLAGADREHFAALLLDTKNRLIGVTTVSVGDLSSALVHPREVFKPAILASAASIIVGHNHPSGDMEPSPEDIAVTRRLAEAGELLGIALLDHVIIGERGSCRSLKEAAVSELERNNINILCNIIDIPPTAWYPVPGALGRLPVASRCLIPSNIPPDIPPDIPPKIRPDSCRAGWRSWTTRI